MIFCDTSTLAKFYVNEVGSPAVRARLESEPQVVLSELARAELMGVFHRRLREKKWTRTEFLTVVRQFSRDDAGGYWSWVPIDSGLIVQVMQTFSTLPENVFLRTADCLHLVCAIQQGFRDIFTHDTHQLEASSALGLRAIPIE